MTIYVDIDETICEKSSAGNYGTAAPIRDRIDVINRLYDEGNIIIYWTARGTMTGLDWSEVTHRQFTEWGVKYHKLKFGKPVYDLFIDDKNISSQEFFKE